MQILIRNFPIYAFILHVIDRAEELMPKEMPNMSNLCGTDDNEVSNKYCEIYTKSTKKRESNLGRRGMTEKPVRLKFLLSKLDLEKLDEENADERRCNSSDSLFCSPDFVQNEDSLGGADSLKKDSFGYVSMEVENDHHSVSSSGTVLSGINHFDSQESGLFKRDYSDTYEEVQHFSHTETKSSVKISNKMHEAITHPPLKSAASFFHRSVCSKDVKIQNNEISEENATQFHSEVKLNSLSINQVNENCISNSSSQKLLVSNESTNSALPHKVTENVQVQPIILNKDLNFGKTTVLQDIMNHQDSIGSKMRAPLTIINSPNFAIPVSENQKLHANVLSLHNKENAIPAQFAPFKFSTPAKSESACLNHGNAFKTFNTTGRSDGHASITPIPSKTVYKPFYMPSTITPMKEDGSVERPDVFSKRNIGSEIPIDLSLPTNTNEAASVTGSGSDKTLQSVASHQAHSLSLQPSTLSVPNQPQECLFVNGKKYIVECVLGRGGSSKVYQVLHPDTSNHLAIKCVNLSDTEPEIAQGYQNEIKLLKKLQGNDNVIRMFDYEYVPAKQMLYVILEKGDMDLSKLLKSLSDRSRLPISTIVSYWLEMLAAVKSIHANGIIHSDLKPANFLIVNGHLKLIDFGIASSLQNEMTSISKDITTGTYNYMSPEAIQDPSNTNENNTKIRINYKSDIWSLGCILYNLLYGKTPFQHIRQVWAKLAAIKDSRTQVHYPPPPEGCPAVFLQALKLCLQYDPKQRPSAEELQQLPYQYCLQMDLLLNRIKQEISENPNPEVVKTLKALFYKHN